MASGDHIHDESNDLFSGQSRLERIKKYIDDNLSSDLSAAVVSEKFSISISTLHHSFKKHLLQSYHSTIINIINMGLAYLFGMSASRWRQCLAGDAFRHPAHTVFTF